MVRTDRRLQRRFDPDLRRVAILETMAAALAVHPHTEVIISSIAAETYFSSALVHHYSTNKEDLYAEIVRAAVVNLLTRQAKALDILPDGASVRDHIRAATIVYLDHIATHPNAWVVPIRRPGGEPTTVIESRARTCCDYVKRLRDLLVPSTQARHDYASWGYFGFIDAAALRWVGKGCPEEGRWALVDVALGALEGTLGGWIA